MWFFFIKMHHIYFLLLMLLAPCNCNNESKEKSPLINAQMYSNIFVRRRVEHRTLLDHFQRTEKYDRKFKLLEIGIQQILQILRENREKLLQEGYTTSAGFPKTSNLIDGVTLVLENTCLIGDLVLHLPDMSEQILTKDTQWKETLNWAIQFTLSVPDVIDAKTSKMLSLFDQEINIEKRTDHYINPYRETKKQPTEPTKRKKERKKLKKGPQLHSTGRTEL